MLKSFFQGLAALAAFNIARGDEQSVEEAVDLLNEACATTKGSNEVEEEMEKSGHICVAEGNGSPNADEGGIGGDVTAARLAHASVLCSSAQGDLVLGRGTTTASDRLGEALRLREKLLPGGHPATVRSLASVLTYCFRPWAGLTTTQQRGWLAGK